jgi:hypothetical protein
MSILPLNQGGTGSDLSATGGAGQVVKQTSSGADLSVAAIAIGDLPTSGTWPFAGTISGNPKFTDEITAGNINTVLYVDGVQFDTVADALAVLGPLGGGTVFIPAGTFPVAPTVTIPAGVRLIGMGSNPILGVAGSNITKLTFTSSLTLQNITGTYWQNLELDFSGATSPAGVVLTAVGSGGNAFCDNHYFRDVILSGVGGANTPGLKLAASGTGFVSCAFNRFENVTIQGNTNQSGANPGPAFCAIQLIGSGTPDAGPSVTQNSFYNTFLRGGLIGGIDIETNADTNFFYNTAYLQEWALNGTISAAANASGGNTAYTGTFNPTLIVGLSATVSGFLTHTVNNGTYTVVSCSATTLVLNNPNGVAETHTATVKQSPTPTNSYMLGFNLNSGTPGSDVDANACWFYGVNLTGNATSYIRSGQASGHLIDIEAFGSAFSVVVVGGSPQFSGRITNLNQGRSYIYDFTGTGFQILGTPQFQAATFQANLSPAYAISNFALSASPSWGAGASVGNVVSSGGMSSLVTINTGTVPAANPTITVTFPKAFASVPICQLTQNGGTHPAGVLLSQVSIATTSVTFLFIGTPQASKSISCVFSVLP